MSERYFVGGTLTICILLRLPAGALLVGQEPPPSTEQRCRSSWTLRKRFSDQLANLVAPVALYPDSLLSQVLVAATYPLEIVEAGQWLQQNRNLCGAITSGGCALSKIGMPVSRRWWCSRM